ncbi:MULTISPECIES: MFS transporter [Pseudofrankia]|uniref:MFS transporter n=1 Tax=Pseudofrankia TaxID=2994363 RepID=UPI000568722E|nr:MULTISPECIES: MFS transporter [Pseudofrankia]OHV38118.1 multidrug MFS transporter [Pseudofrankia sp. EUN1h]
MTDTALDEPQRSAPVARVWGPQLRVLTGGLVSTITLLAFESLAVITVAPLVSADLRGLNLYGWLTGAFFLTTVVGLVLAGAAMDRAGPARPFVVGLLLFGAGLAVAAGAMDMQTVIVGRGLQGLGDGAIAAVCFGTVGRTYPAELRPKVFAVLATAWVVPSLGGPAAAAFLAERVGWRWVFGGLIPLVVVAGAVTVRALRLAAGTAPPPVDEGALTATGGVKVAGAAESPETPETAGTPGVWPAVEAGRGPLVRAVRVAAGAGLLLAGLTSRSLLGIPLVVAGLLAGIGPLRRLLPAGTLRARPGAPAAVAVRGLLAFAFFGADTFVPLAITSVRHASATVAGLAVSTVAIVWTVGSWTQARLASRRSGRFLVTTGLATLVLSVAATGTALLITGVPLAVGIACWGVAGFGIGIAYSPIMNVALNEAPPDRQGMASSAVSLSDNLGVAFGAGLGGVAVAAGSATNRTAADATTGVVATAGQTASAGHSASATGLAAAFALATAAGLVGLVAARRLPTTALAQAPAVSPPDGLAG